MAYESMADEFKAEESMADEFKPKESKGDEPWRMAYIVYEILKYRKKEKGVTLMAEKY